MVLPDDALVACSSTRIVAPAKAAVTSAGSKAVYSLPWASR
jgi:hypothetical protein